MRRKTVEARVLHAGRPSCRLASGICTLQDAQNLSCKWVTVIKLLLFWNIFIENYTSDDIQQNHNIKCDHLQVFGLSKMPLVGWQEWHPACRTHCFSKPHGLSFGNLCGLCLTWCKLLINGPVQQELKPFCNWNVHQSVHLEQHKFCISFQGYAIHYLV